MDGTHLGSDPAPQPPASARAPDETRRWLVAKRIVVCGLVLYHLAAVTIGNLVEAGSLSQTLHRYVNPYLRLFGQWQEWDMFTTIPLYLTIEGKVVARAMDGKETRYDPLLPGFTKGPDSLRLISMFARVVWARKSFRLHVERYQRAVCHAIAEREGSMPRSVRVELDTLTIRQLTAIRKDGVIGDPRTYKSEEAPCPR
jgi:hypothetical protein